MNSLEILIGKLRANFVAYVAENEAYVKFVKQEPLDNGLYFSIKYGRKNPELAAKKVAIAQATLAKIDEMLKYCAGMHAFACREKLEGFLFLVKSDIEDLEREELAAGNGYGSATLDAFYGVYQKTIALALEQNNLVLLRTSVGHTENPEILAIQFDGTTNVSGSIVHDFMVFLFDQLWDLHIDQQKSTESKLKHSRALAEVPYKFLSKSITAQMQMISKEFDKRYEALDQLAALEIAIEKILDECKKCDAVVGASSFRAFFGKTAVASNEFLVAFTKNVKEFQTKASELRAANVSSLLGSGTSTLKPVGNALVSKVS